jgi:GxxExxY protein
MAFRRLFTKGAWQLNLQRLGIIFVREQEHTIFYEGVEVGTRRADFVIEGRLSVELKALINLEDVHLAQAKITQLLTISNRIVNQFWRHKSTIQIDIQSEIQHKN